MKTPLTEEQKKKRKEDLTPVTGTFYWHTKPGCTMTFYHKSIWDDKPEQYTLTDQKEETIPKFLKDYLNDHGFINIAHKYLLHPEGHMVGVAQYTKKRVFSFR